MLTPEQLKVTHRFTQLGELRMHTVEAGDGAPVVLLHGFPECWWSWRHQLGPLAEAGYRAIAPDLRGYGETDKHGPYGLDTVTDDVCRLIDSLGAGPAVHLVGHDWGGALAWHLAALRPEHCRSLTVINCPHPAVLNEALMTRPKLSQLKRSWYMFFFQVPHLAEWLLTRNDAGEIVRQLRGNAIDKTNFSAEELRPLRDAIQRPGAAAAMVGWYRAALKDALARRGRPVPYPVIHAPAQLIWGLEDLALGFDDLVPATRRWADGLRVEPIPHCGHFAQSEQPARVNRLLLEFLKSVSPATP